MVAVYELRCGGGVGGMWSSCGLWWGFGSEIAECRRLNVMEGVMNWSVAEVWGVGGRVVACGGRSGSEIPESGRLSVEGGVVGWRRVRVGSGLSEVVDGDCG